jgi:hypothetical protein
MVKTPPEPLPAFYRKKEKNRFLQEMKTDIAKKFDFRYRSILCQRDLAICLIALGRNGEALRVLDYAHQHVKFRRKYDVWYAAASACCVAANVRRSEGNDQRAKLDLQRFVDEPCHALMTQPEIWTATFVRRHIAGERKHFGPSFDSADLSVAVEAMAWWAATLIFFREMAVLGFPQKGKLNVARLDVLIDEALALLRNRLQSEAM